jgi:hypothetical protein
MEFLNINTIKIKNEIGVYAVKNEHDNGLRYFAIGIKNKEEV